MRKLMLVALLAAAACGGPPFKAREKDPDRVATVDATVLVVLDDQVKWGIELVDHREEILPDGRLRAHVRLVNRTPADMHVQMTWTFKDDRNFPVEADSPFEHVLISAGQTLSLTRESRAAGAKAFHVQLKTAKSGQD